MKSIFTPSTKTIPACISLMKIFSAAFFSVSSAMAAVPYPSPFPDTINSAFGPRFYAPSPFHAGIDYEQSSGTSIPAASSGYINEIKNDNNDCGVRLYLVTGDKLELGYCHLFAKTTKPAYASGNFILLTNYTLVRRISIIGLRASSISTKCNIILANNADQGKKVALVPKSCAFAVGRTLTYNKVTYTITNKVTDAQSIAPVGNSGSAAGPHLHLNFGRGKDNPLQVIDHPNGTFCARLSDAGASQTACDPVTSTPVIQQSALNNNKYIEVRVDSTARIDLDQIRFNISTSPVQSFSLQYGGTVSTSPLVNGSSDIKSAIDVTCSTAPTAGRVVICPLDWRGQRVSTSRLETKFRLGIDPTVFVPGNYVIEVTPQAITGSNTTISLPFTIGGGIPTATLAVPDQQAGWTGLPATISLTNLVPTSIFTFQSFGNSTTCGTGERGSPLYSSVVPTGAVFYAARTVTGVPYQLSGPGINRNNCSSFVAIQLVPNPNDASQVRRRVWINGTGRGQQFGTFTLDWESQVRFDSGDPWTGVGRSCAGGTVANSGFFGTAWRSANCNASLNF
jgi:hypothetical protein